MNINLTISSGIQSNQVSLFSLVVLFVVWNQSEHNIVHGMIVIGGVKT